MALKHAAPEGRRPTTVPWFARRPPAAALLECLVKHLFDPDLDAPFLGKRCGATRDARTRLAAAVGPLKTYVIELRKIEAKRLVRDTKLEIQEIAERLGYRVVKTFRRTFKKRHGMRPYEMRRQARAQRAEQTEAPDPVAAAAGAQEDLPGPESAPQE